MIRVSPWRATRASARDARGTWSLGRRSRPGANCGPRRRTGARRGKTNRSGGDPPVRRCGIVGWMSDGGPFHGIRVVELAGLGPSQHGVMLLADLGADVVRVDRPAESGADRDAARRTLLNRGRRSIALDLKDGADREVALRLADGADVLVDPYRPGVLERLGLGPDVLLGRNPRIVVARMTGWGQDGPRAGDAGHDIDYIAAAGALHAIGRAGRRARRPAEPRRRLRRRRDAARVRRRGGAHGARALRPRPGGRRGDGRRGRIAHELRVAGARDAGAGRRSAGATGCRAPRPGTAPTRRRTARSSPSARTSPSSTRRCSSASASTPPPGRSGTGTAGRR